MLVAVFLSFFADSIHHLVAVLAAIANELGSMVNHCQSARSLQSLLTRMAGTTDGAMGFARFPFAASICPN
jgi:hypothetical protein